MLTRVRRLRRRSGLIVWILTVVVAVVATALLVGGDDEDEDKPAAAKPPPPTAPPPAALRSDPELRPPALSVDVTPRRPGNRLVFMSPRMEEAKRDGRTHQQGALAVDEQGRTRWFHAAPDGEPITDVRVQRYRGKPVLTWWEGAASMLGIGRGRCVIVDESYREIASVQAGNGKTSDLHEFRLTPRGTALLTIYSRSRQDLTELGGKPNSQVTQGIVQEVDVESGRVLFEWESLDEIKPEESVRPLPKPPQDSFDYFHINSVAEDNDGNLLVSARHTSAVYKINRKTGKLMWRLGGKNSDFRLGKGVRFALQHDAQRDENGNLRLFDNGPEPKEGEAPEPSSAKVIRLDMRRMRATLVRRLRQPDGMYAMSQGNVDSAGGGELVVGWGSTGAVSWFGAGGNVLLDAHLPAQYDSYRAHVGRWTGRPDEPPVMELRREREQVTVWASWNGATRVQAWQVMAGPSAEKLQPVGRPAPWKGIETAIVRATAQPYIAVQALDGAGRPLQRSEPVRAPAPPPPRP